MHSDIHNLRVGYQKRGNFLPLLYPLEAGWVAPESPWRVEVVNAPSGELLARTLEGELDAAFLAPGAVAGHGGQLAALGGWGLACEGRVETAIVLAPQRLDLIHEGHVSIAPEAVGSTAEHTFRTLLAPYYGISLSLHLPDDPAYDPGGARLLYGDDAAREVARKPSGWVAEDLGVSWFVFTGLPAVWEVFAAPRDLEARKPGAGQQLQELLRLSQRTAREQEATVTQVAADRLGLEPPAVKDLFSRQRFTLGDAEQKGLARFLDQASRARVIRL
jgi:predicted solute-binding protein